MSAACPVFGLIVRLEPATGIGLDALLRALRIELLQSRGLVATPLGASGEEIAITGDGFQATDADREAIVGWLKAQPLVARYQVSQLGDVGHVV